MNCHSCGLPLADGTATARIRWDNFGPGSARLNGTTISVHARCLRLEPTPGRESPAMPERVSDPEHDNVDAPADTLADDLAASLAAWAPGELSEAWGR